MKLNKKDLKIEYMRGKGPGGQRKNKLDTACRITHVPTGVSAYADERSQHHSKRRAMQDLKQKLKNIIEERKAKDKKAKRDYAIHNTKRIRTYDFKKNTVTDHRTNKTASLKEVVGKGKIELLR
jgi:peptide chain release factor 1